MIVNHAIESLTPNGIRRLQERRALDLVARVYETNPFYRARFDAVGLHPRHITSLADFQRLVPFTDKQALLDDQNAAPPYGTRALGSVRQFHLTSGTSGTGQEIHTLSAGDVEALGGAAHYQFGWAGIGIGDLVALTLPAGTTLAAPYFNQAMLAVGSLPLYLGALEAEAKIAMMRRFRPRALVAVPAYLHRLEVVCRSLGVDPRRDLPELDVIFTATEAFSPQWAERVQDFWGVRLHEWYGATQAAGVFMCTCESGVLGGTAGDGARGVLHSLDHRVLVEVRDPDTGAAVADGEVGEAVVTVLHRESFPCLRFRMGDRIRRLPPGSCRCGRPFASHESGTIARYDDMIKIRGLNVWPSLVDSVVLTSEVVAEYRGTVSMDAATGREMVTLAVEFTRPLEDAEQSRRLAALGEALHRTIGLSFTLQAAPIGSLPKTDFKIRRWTDDRERGRTSIGHVESSAP